MNPVSDFLCNLIHYVLSKQGNVAPLSYTDTSCSFSIYLSKNELNMKKELMGLLDELTTVDWIYDLNDPRSIFLDQVPTYQDGVFKYNPCENLVNLSSQKEILVKLINSLYSTKKSRSLKYNFQSP